ncbi:hypothetical protein M426DRAFT_316991 [Hypoxylon sp. CI-4A]|nr:hypothetical protein M426DRAFT_316991 [Hypoxylon sp. CI-4A]
MADPFGSNREIESHLINLFAGNEGNNFEPQQPRARRGSWGQENIEPSAAQPATASSETKSPEDPIQKLNGRINGVLDHMNDVTNNFTHRFLLLNERINQVLAAPRALPSQRGTAPRNAPAASAVPTAGRYNYQTKDPNPSIDKQIFEDIGVFDPQEINNLYDISSSSRSPSFHHHHRGTRVFRDVYEFVDYVKLFLEGPNFEDKEKHLLGRFPAHLSGSALHWWNHELRSTDRQELQGYGIYRVLTALRKRFGLDAADAARRFREGSLSGGELAASSYVVAVYVRTKLRCARVSGLLADDNANWRAVMLHIWCGMDPDVRLFVRPPAEDESFEGYMRELELVRAPDSAQPAAAADPAKKRNYYPPVSIVPQQQQQQQQRQAPAGATGSTHSSLGYGRQPTYPHHNHHHARSNDRRAARGTGGSPGLWGVDSYRSRHDDADYANNNSDKENRHPQRRRQHSRDRDDARGRDGDRGLWYLESRTGGGGEEEVMAGQHPDFGWNNKDVSGLFEEKAPGSTVW